VSVNGRNAFTTCSISCAPNAPANDRNTRAPTSSPPTSNNTVPSGRASNPRTSGRMIGNSEWNCSPRGTTTRIPRASISSAASRQRKYGFTTSRSAIARSLRPASANRIIQLTETSVFPLP
jgi:hypothetical protein